MVRGFVLLMLATVAYSVAQMDESIGGKSVGKYHVSVFDSEKRLYLYSGGD